MGSQQIGNPDVIFAIPDFIGKAVGVDSKLIQKLNLKFDNKNYAKVEIELIPECGKTLQDALNGFSVVLSRGVIDAK